MHAVPMQFANMGEVTPYRMFICMNLQLCISGATPLYLFPLNYILKVRKYMRI